ncbi:hypothetical protein HAX54_035257 [Datura stramonium]|uniref:Uncharacterized protein n=1 Tax=Datura stramonium TaxID=4076 RepID=A0ABS8VHT2_DATST|nr:hypothetical protein [Datura stramonium]
MLEALSDEHFAVVIIISVILVTVIITPLLRFLLRAIEQQTPTKRRTLQHPQRPDTELRILVCVHDLQSVPTMVNLLEASNPTEHSPIGVIALVLGKHHQDSPLLMGLGEWSECPELGVVGDFLASPDVGITASVLVVQQQRELEEVSE